jgi:outer membrane protein insertion porin family
MRLHLLFPLVLLFSLAVPFQTPAQTATLREVHSEGLKALTEADVASLSGLTIGSQVGRKELQDGADALVRTGLFSKVNFSFATRGEAVTLTFRVEENPQIPVSYDNFPWYSDSELNEAIHKDLPFFSGKLPQAGAAVERAASSLKSFVTQRDSTAQIEHLVIANPLGEGSVQQFRIEGPSPQIASVEFSDPTLAQNLVVKTHLSEIVGKPYSRLSIDVFLGEQIRPIYQQAGFLRAQIGPAEVRLSGNPTQKFPEQIPVFIPSQPGAVFKFKSEEWSGNNVLSSLTLTRDLGLKPGEIADGMAIEAAWDRIREEYGHRGYLDVKLDPVAVYDDPAHTVSYSVRITEGPQYKYSGLTISGMSLAGERKIREAWPLKEGEVFDKSAFEQILTRMETHHESVFRDLAVHYDTVGHWLQTDPAQATVEVLLDFK